MDIRPQFLQAFLVLDPEVLLFIDDEQPQLAELDAGCQQRMGADDDVDGAPGEPVLRFVYLLARDEPGGPGDPQRVALEALREGGEMLPGQKRRRNHDRN